MVSYPSTLFLGKPSSRTAQPFVQNSMGCCFTIYSLFLDIHNLFKDIHNSFMDILNSFMDILK